MKKEIISEFIEKWRKYFGSAALPITFFYTDHPLDAVYAGKPTGWNCLIAELARVRNGNNIFFDSESITCGGGKRYCGYTDQLRPNFEYFLSYGIPGKMEGERYIKTPEMVKEMMKNMVDLPANNKKLVFKRWDKLQESDNPEAVIFLATPDVLSGLFTLANFDQPDGLGVFCQFSAGCGSVVKFPLLEAKKENPRAVIGMFDPSARPCVPAGTLSFAVPFSKFGKMISYMDESFLITETWEKIRKRIEAGGQKSEELT